MFCDDHLIWKWNDTIATHAMVMEVLEYALRQEVIRIAMEQEQENADGADSIPPDSNGDGVDSDTGDKADNETDDEEVEAMEREAIHA